MKGERLGLRIDGALKEKMLAWSKKNNVSLSDAVTRFFGNLLEHEKKKRKAKKRVP